MEEPNIKFGIIDTIVNALRSSTTFGLPEYTVRAIICMALVIPMLYLQWISPVDGKVPAELTTAAMMATGWYLTSSASSEMKALLSILFVVVQSAFCLSYGWVPPEVAGGVSTIIGIYFGKKQAFDSPPTEGSA